MLGTGAALTLFSCALLAQSSSPADPNAPSFRSGVSLVTVPVVVRDREGHAVKGLPKEAFQVLDEGKPQEIVSFSEESALPKGTYPNHFTAYVFDDMSVMDPGEIAAVRDAATNRLAQLNSDERVAIISTSCRVLLDFGHDPEKLNAAVAELRNAPLPQCRSAANEPLEFAVLRSVIQRISTLPGQRSIVFVSAGFRMPREAQPFLDQVISSAAASKVSIDVLEIGRLSGGGGAHNSGGLWGTSSQNVIQADGTSGEMAQPSATYSPEPMPHPMAGDQLTGVLRDLAHGAGGSLVEGGNKLDPAFRKLAPPDSWYLLGFLPQNLQADDKFHPLKVKLRAAGKLSVQSRSGYYAASKPHPGATP